MPTATATPVEQLRDTARRLEAALTVGLATPSAKAVHELRSSTRRVEAQLDLLALITGLPAYKPAAAKVLRRLTTLRRKAGRVRDRDVQDKLLEDQDHRLRSAAEAPAGLDKAQATLRKRIAKARQRSERRLLAEIDRQLPKLGRDTERLLKALKPARDRQVSVPPLLDRITRRIEPLLLSEQHGEDHLHEIRKAAKRARYQCEAMPGPEAAALGRRLESLQDAGGSWHDLLDLATLCHRELGPEHPLARVLEHLRDEHLDRYLANLEDFRTRHTPRSIRKPPQRASASHHKSHRTAAEPKRRGA